MAICMHVGGVGSIGCSSTAAHRSPGSDFRRVIRGAVASTGGDRTHVRFSILSGDHAVVVVNPGLQLLHLFMDVQAQKEVFRIFMRTR